MQAIKNIIFDLGGVLLDIDFTLTAKAFEDLGVHDFLSLYNQHHADTFFADFEKGKVPVDEFYDHIRRICQCDHLTNDQIRDAWDALLIRFPQERINWLMQIAEKYSIFLFSNTNILHYQWFAAAFEEQTGKMLNNCFVKAYYSHEMGIRKPAFESYQMILDEQQLNVAETLFIDDTVKNTEAAQAMGMQVIHLVKPATVLDLGL